MVILRLKHPSEKNHWILSAEPAFSPKVTQKFSRQFSLLDQIKIWGDIFLTTHLYMTQSALKGRYHSTLKYETDFPKQFSVALSVHFNQTSHCTLIQTSHLNFNSTSDRDLGCFYMLRQFLSHYDQVRVEPFTQQHTRTRVIWTPETLGLVEQTIH